MITTARGGGERQRRGRRGRGQPGVITRWFTPRPAVAPLVVVVDILGAGPQQYLLAPPQLGGERLQGPLGQVSVQVGDQADRVRQRRAALERRAALVVDQYERHLVRAVHQGQRGDQGLQQLRLAGPRR